MFCSPHVFAFFFHEYIISYMFCKYYRNTCYIWKASVMTWEVRRGYVVTPVTHTGNLCLTDGFSPWCSITLRSLVSATCRWPSTPDFRLESWWPWVFPPFAPPPMIYAISLRISRALTFEISSISLYLGSQTTPSMSWSWHAIFLRACSW
jgi:hypothetical protein